MKRYEIGIDCANKAEENAQGDWVKWEDLEVVVSVIKERVQELERTNTELRAEIGTLKALARDNQ